MAVGSDLEQVIVESRADLRRWLTRHRGQKESIWLVTWKKGDPRHLPYNDIVEEALCFGWIDSLPRKLDESRTMLLLSPRKKGSGWSKLNKARAERMIAAGLMTADGLARIDEAKADGAWSKLDAVDALAIPPDLAAAFREHPPAAKQWSAFPPSARRGILEWIAQAKRPETRARRIDETARSAAKGERANQWRK